MNSVAAVMHASVAHSGPLPGVGLMGCFGGGMAVVGTRVSPSLRNIGRSAL